MLHDERRAHLASMISSRLSPEKKIIEPFKNPNKGPLSFLETTYLEQEAAFKQQVSCHLASGAMYSRVYSCINCLYDDVCMHKSLQINLLFCSVLFRHAVLLAGRYENPLYSGQRSM